MPPVVQQWYDTLFGMTGNATTVPPSMATMLAAWMTLPAGIARLPIPGADTALVRTLDLMVNPHPYVTPLLQAYQDGLLSWCWIVTHDVPPILADATQSQGRLFRWIQCVHRRR
jgi:hypothetical protein